MFSFLESSDAVSPTVVTSCPDDIIRDVTPGTGEVSVTWVEPTFSDLVDGNNLFVMQTKASRSLFPEGSTEVLYTAMDTKYNVVQCMFTVTINGKLKSWDGPFM